MPIAMSLSIILASKHNKLFLFNTVHVIRVGMAASLTEAVIDLMKAEDGTIKSAWKWLRDKNIEHLDIFVEATATGRREWTYRTQHVQHPDEGVTHAIFLAPGGWQDEVAQGLGHLLYAAECADRLQLQTRPDILQKTFDYGISLA